MNDVKTYMNLKRVSEVYQEAKQTAISFGANPDQFIEADAKMNELLTDAKEKIGGGMMQTLAEIEAKENPFPAGGIVSESDVEKYLSQSEEDKIKAYYKAAANRENPFQTGGIVAESEYIIPTKIH